MGSSKTLIVLAQDAHVASHDTSHVKGNEVMLHIIITTALRLLLHVPFWQSSGSWCIRFHVEGSAFTPVSSQLAVCSDTLSPATLLRLS